MSEKSKELRLAQELMQEGDFEEALQIVDKLEELIDLNDKERLSYYLLKGSILYNLSQF
jgi:dihydrodipicolinate synthase/N-acetylneuraminate lyase